MLLAEMSDSLILGAIAIVVITGLGVWGRGYRRAKRNARRQKHSKMAEDRVVIDVHKLGFDFKAIAHPFWMRKYAKWEPETFFVFKHFLNKESDYLDIGGWIGPTVLYGANLSRKSYVIEPDPKALHDLEENIRLNPNLNVELVKAALGDTDEPVKIYSNNLEDSNSSLLADRGGLDEAAHSVEVPGMSVQSLFGKYDLANLSLVKMDIEGGEIIVLPVLLPSLVERKIPLLVSLHPKYIASSACDDLIRLLKESYPYLYDMDLKTPFVRGKTDTGAHGGIDIVCSFEPVQG